MSKCQINKYLPGGRCGGDVGKSELNPQFDSSLSRLIQQREQLDMAMKPVQEPAAKPNQTQQTQKQQIQTQAIAIIPTVKRNKEADIELLLQGDYVE